MLFGFVRKERTQSYIYIDSSSFILQFASIKNTLCLYLTLSLSFVLEFCKVLKYSECGCIGEVRYLKEVYFVTIFTMLSSTRGF